jgi:amino acid transporter
VWLGAALFLGYRLRNKCLCVYTRASTQEIEKFVSLQDRHVSFDKKRFDIVPGTQRLKWKSIMGIFGTWVVAYHFVWYSRFPENPNIYNVPIESPEARHDMNQEEKFRAYQRAESQRDKVVKTKGSLMSFIPWIIVAVVLAFIMYTLYTQGKDMNVIKQALQSLLTRGQ